MTPTESFLHIMEGLGAGEPQAAETVFQKFTGRLIGLARTHLSDKLRQKVDSEDIAQSVMKSFFARQEQQGFDVGSWADLWSLLVVMTLRKCARQAARYQAARRDVSREQAIGSSSRDGDWQFLQEEPTPAQALLLSETIEKLIQEQTTEEAKRIIRLALEGYGAREISEQVKLSERTVQRILKRVREKLERRAEE